MATTKSKQTDEQTVDDQGEATMGDNSVSAVPAAYPYDPSLAKIQQEQYTLTVYIDLVIKADQADVIPNDEARTRVTKALDRLQAMAEGMASA